MFCLGNPSDFSFRELKLIIQSINAYALKKLEMLFAF